MTIHYTTSHHIQRRSSSPEDQAPHGRRTHAYVTEPPLLIMLMIGGVVLAGPANGLRIAGAELAQPRHNSSPPHPTPSPCQHPHPRRQAAGPGQCLPLPPPQTALELRTAPAAANATHRWPRVGRWLVTR